MRNTILAVIVGFLLIVLAAQLEKHWKSSQPISFNRSSLRTGSAGDKSVGQKLPPNTVFQRVPDRERTTLEQAAGKATLVNFWASWCEACVAEMPSIQKLYDTLKQDGLRVISINLDENASRVVPGLINRMHLTFPVFFEQGTGLADQFDVMAIPFSVVLDRNYAVAWSESGDRDWASERVIEEFRKLLK